MNFVTRKTLPRRTFLRAAGASVALPLLDAMVPAFASSTGSERSRLVCIEEVHGLPGCNKWGATQYLFAPKTVGRDYELAPLNPLKSLEPWREHFTIVSNTDVRMAEAFLPPEVGGDHFRSSAVFLTHVHPRQTKGSDIHGGTSMDQLYAQRVGHETVIPSLQLGIESTNRGGGCDYNYSCSYVDCISWASPTEPLPVIQNPRTAFDMLFGAGGTPEERARRRRTYGSILDWVGEEVRSMAKDLSAVDRRRVDQYLEDVREIERRIQKVEAQHAAGQERDLPGAPPGIPESYTEHVKLMFDLQVLAFRTDATRVVSFKTGRDASNRVFPESGSDRAFHPSSHHGDRKDAILEFNKICQYRVGQLAYFLKRLQETTDGESSLLDQSVILWGSPMGDANIHNHRRCPLVVFGGGNGRFHGGTHLQAPEGTPMANAMLAILNKLGLEMESFGDSTGEMSL